MTEEQWQNGTDSVQLVGFIRDRMTGRKIRLFDCASCRYAWDLLDQRCRRAVEILEDYADGLATEQERQAAWSEARAATADDRLSRAARHAAWGVYNAGAPFPFCGSFDNVVEALAWA